MSIAIRPFPEMQAIAHANSVQNKFVRAFFHPLSFSNQCSHLITQLSFPMFELLTVKYQGVSKYRLCVYQMVL